MQLIKNNELFTQIYTEESVTANGGDVLNLTHISNDPDLMNSILSYFKNNTFTNFS
ncbi:MAG: hypothetical protein ACKPE3_09110 [Sphaerospermopsis kisseleviana]